MENELMTKIGIPKEKPRRREVPVPPLPDREPVPPPVTQPPVKTPEPVPAGR